MAKVLLNISISKNNLVKNLLLGILCISVCSCEKKTTESVPMPAVEKETVFVEKPADTVFINKDFKENTSEKTGYFDGNNAPSGDLSGDHALTLQWISWDVPGKINFTKTGDKTYKVAGQQRKGNDYLSMEGVITQLSPKHLRFEGTIETDIKANGGKCVRTGVQDFLVTKNRKYWRLQNMEHCFGLTDYIDIYFGNPFKK